VSIRDLILGGTMKTKTRAFILAAAFVMSMLAVATTARAQTTVGDCIDQIDVVQDDLDTIYKNGGIGGRNSDQTYDSLTSKLQGAIKKLGQGKDDDALQKLQDFKTAVEAMAGALKPKLSASDADLLLDGFDGDDGVKGAIVCVALLP